MLAKLHRRGRLDWPLLGKELLEQAARKQMYVVRVLYALVLFGAFCFYYQRHLADGPVLALGRGLGPFQFLVNTQMLAIFLFLPPMMAGALAQEKERETLGLLFLTDLTPWELILQKYVGRLIPMLTLLFLSLPLLAVAYSLGGVSADLLYASAVRMFLTCLWVGALALNCSAHEGSTFQALLRCWGLILVFAMCCAMGPFGISFMLYQFQSGMASSVSLIVSVVIYSVPIVFFLVRAKENLEKRAFVQRRNPFGQQFKQLDQYWKDLRKLTRAILRKRDHEAKALAEQVMQRDLGMRGDSRAWSLSGYLFARMQIPSVLALAIIFGVIVLIALVANIVLEPKSGGAFIVVVGGIWILALLTIPIQSANAVASERINERLGAILTTPLSAREILAEWLGPVERWTQFLARPLILIFAVEAIVKFVTQETSGSLRWSTTGQYLALALATVLVYPALARWGCLWIGLRVRSQMRALMTALLLSVAWCVVPLFGSGYLIQTGLLAEGWGEPIRFISPMTVIGSVEGIGRNNAQAPVTSEMIIMAVIHLALAALLLWLARRVCLRKADHYLGRI